MRQPAFLSLGFLLQGCGADEIPGARGQDSQANATDDTGDSQTYDTGDGTGPALTVELLAPVEGQQLFLGTRYDLVALSPDAGSLEATVSGATLDCSPFAAGLLHCGLIALDPGEVTLAMAATAGEAQAATSLSLEARAAEGLVPAGERFAMGMYEVMDSAWMEPVAEAGFELVQSYGTGGYTHEAWEGWAADAGLWTMARTSWSWSDPWGAPYTDEELAAVADFSQIAWWELPDNDVGDDSNVGDVADLVDRIRAVDDRPIYLYLWTSTTTEQIEAYVPYLDLIGPGAYPEHACQPQPWIRWRVSSAVDAVHNSGYTTAEKPVLGLADLYGIPDTGCEAAELAQVRMNPLAQIAAGATGVLYFAWYYAVHELDPAWSELAGETAHLIMGESGLGEAVVHGTPIGDLEVTVTAGPDLSEAFTPYGLSDSVQYPSIHAAAWEHAGTRFAVAVNYTDEVVEAQIDGFPARTPGVEVVGEARVLSTTEGVITEQFEPWGAHVYRAPIVEP